MINAANETLARSAAGKLEPKVSGEKGQRTVVRVSRGVNANWLNPPQLPAPLPHVISALFSVLL